ncbi:MAG TPA: glycosyltransferase family 39 protein [Vicinamibacterales bacterium]|nr:glycosyltransferase family 39 protein [Vicinamibacterales bacterium]
MTALMLLALLVVAWLPGAVMFRLPVLDRERRAALPAEERAYWVIVLSVASSIALVLAMGALHRYSFKRLLLAEVAFAGVLALLARFDLRFGTTAKRVGLGAVLPLALALLSAWRFMPPSEYVIGGKDPGVYVNEGVQIAQRGALVVRDPVVAGVPDFARDLFFPSDKNRDRFVGPRFMGFYVLDPDRGAVVGQFPQAYPASIAIGYAVDGLTGARATVCFWGVLGVLSVYFLGARLLGRAAAAAAALLLALNVIQVWFARYPNADIVMQGLLFAALLANARAHVDDDPFFAPVAGVLLGVLLFLRFDTVVAVGAVVAGIGLGFVAGQRVRWTFWPPLAAATALAGWYYTGPMREYFHLPRVFISNLPPWQIAALAVAMLVVVAVILAGRRSQAISTRVVTFLPSLLAVGVVALAAYAFLLREPGGRLTSYDAHALRTFANFYFTVPALIAALVGYALVARALFWRDPAFVFTLTAFSLFFFYKIRIWPDHFWMARRFVPVILPGGLLLVAGAALTGVRGRLLFTRALRGPIGIVFIALLAVQYARAAKPIVEHVEYAGIVARLEELASQVHDDDLLVVESRDAGSDVHVLALPLAYIYARNVLVLSTPIPDKTTFAAFLDRSHARYGRVLFLGSGGTDLLSSRWSVQPVVSDRFQIPEYDSPRDAYPRFVRRKEFDYSMYAFGPPAADATGGALDVGINDDLNVVRFHAKEQSEGRTFRWSQARSFLIVNRIGAGDRTLALWMNDGGRPAGAPPADVTVQIGDRSLGTVRVTGGFKEYDLAIPADVAATAAATGEPVRIALRTPTWNPLTVLGTTDDRELGVMVDRVAIR